VVDGRTTKQLPRRVAAPLVFVFLLSLGWETPRSAAAPVALVPWVGWAQGVQRARQQQRLVLAYFHKPACRFCERMDAVTFADREVARVVGTCFVPVKVHSFDPAVFRGPSGEKLSGALLRERFRVATFPTVLVLDPQGAQRELVRIPGYTGPRELLQMLAYVTEGWYARMSFGEFLERLLSGKLSPSAKGGCA